MVGTRRHSTQYFDLLLQASGMPSRPYSSRAWWCLLDPVLPMYIYIYINKCAGGGWWRQRHSVWAPGHFSSDSEQWRDHWSLVSFFNMQLIQFPNLREHVYVCKMCWYSTIARFQAHLADPSDGSQSSSIHLKHLESFKWLMVTRYWTLVALVNMQMSCFPNFGEHVCARSACILTPLTDSMTTWKPSGQLTVNFKWSEALDVTRSHSALPYLHKGTAWRQASYSGGKYNVDLRCGSFYFRVAIK